MSELRVERKENMAGGKGHVIIKHILEDKELNGKCKMYAEVTLEPGCSLVFHICRYGGTRYKSCRTENDQCGDEG